ncbi:hypothetical protein F4781DRAFT_237702 [Annulohypoxylon bovei var. microspora]|nr:hypothetical protein F4781DRAFT_237702 [Annulohypoxylon bovei var. microspora]
MSNYQLQPRGVRWILASAYSFCYGIISPVYTGFATWVSLVLFASHLTYIITASYSCRTIGVSRERIGFDLVSIARRAGNPVPFS